MARFATLAALNVNDALPDAWVDEVKVLHDYLIVAGADLTSASSISITAGYHRVTGSTQVNTITDAAGPAKGQELMLQCAAQLAFGTTGNITTASGGVSTYAAGQIAIFVWDGTSKWVETSFSAVTRQVFTTGSGTYTTPAGCTAILVECLGGGGSGGTAQTGSNNTQAASGGGNGGNYAAKLIQGPAATYAYVVGAAGAAVAAGGTAQNGNNGADSTFGASVVVAKGGKGGTLDNQSGAITGVPHAVLPGEPQTGDVGDVILPGEYGGYGLTQVSNQLQGGAGGKGAGPYGGPGAKPQTVYTNATVNGYGPPTGSRGGGSGGGTSSTFGAGASGSLIAAAGLIVVTEFY